MRPTATYDHTVYYPQARTIQPIGVAAGDLHLRFNDYFVVVGGFAAAVVASAYMNLGSVALVTNSFCP